MDRVLKHPCRNCGCSPDVHAFDDDRLGEFALVPWEDRPFRCLGHRHRGCPARCAAFVGVAVTLPDGVRA